MGTGARGRGYLQVRADSPQDIVDAVTGDQRHEDVLKKREKMREKKVGEVSNHPKPNPSSKKNNFCCPGFAGAPVLQRQGQAETSCP